jgi:hypothetical protein
VEILFSYGTLQDSKVQKEVFGRHVTGISDVLDGYETEVIIIEGTTYPRAIPMPHSSLQGTRYILSQSELEKCDVYEGTEYARIKKVLKSGIEAWVYI